MKTTSIVLAALFVFGAAPAAAKVNEARVLLAVGDALEGGRTVVRIHDLDLESTGRWTAHVDVRRPGAPEVAAVVVDGSIVFAQGDPLSNGETVEGIGSARLGANGALLVKYFAKRSTSGAPLRARLALDGVVVLAEDDVVPAPTLPAGVTIDRIRAFDIAGAHVVLACVLDFPAGPPLDATLLYDVQGGALVRPEVLSLRGTAPGGLVRPIDEYLSSIALARDGSHVTTFVQQWGPEGLTAGLYDGVAAFEAGSPAPAGAGAWESVTPRVACATGVGYVVGGALGPSPVGSARGVVATGTAILAIEGAPLAASPGDVVANFLETEVALAETGEAFYSVPLVGGERVLVGGDEVLIRTGTTRADGRLVTGIRFQDLDSLDVSPAGDLVLVEVKLEGGDDAIVLVERRPGVVEGCAVTANSTGAVGALAAYGSSFVTANTLRLEASDLPTGAFGYLLTSRDPGFVPSAGGSAGNLCLGGAIGAVGGAESSGTTGVITRRVDLRALPHPTGAVAAVAGETWRFQMWHRDHDGAGGATSNFTQAVAVTMR